MSLLLPAAVALVSAVQPASATTPVRRLALVAGANVGAPERPRLRFAEQDADRFAAILKQMGGVAEADFLLLKEPTRRGLLDSLAVLRERVHEAQASARRTEVVFYFSGHADDSGLQLGREQLSYPELREQLARVQSDVRIAILDACSSGAITRFKGGRMQPAFLSDISSEVHGQAFLTSSSETEAAQESDQLQGSFFTHALVSGLRGAADVSGDGKVTLNEAYEFAFDETLARTQATAGGSQHPTYDIKMAGSGDVVLTDLRGTRAAIVLGPDLDGRFFVRDGAGRLIAELGKVPGRSVELGVDPGDYEIENQRASTQTRAKIAVADGERRSVTPIEMHGVHRRPTRLRGGGAVDPWTLAGRSRVELRGAGLFGVNTETTATGTSERVSGGAMEIGYAYALRRDVWLDVCLVGENGDSWSRDSPSGSESRDHGSYGGFVGARGFLPMTGAIRPYGLLGLGMLADYLATSTAGSSSFSSSNADFAFRLGGGAEVRIGTHANVSLGVNETWRAGHPSTSVGLAFGWTFGQGR